MNIQEISIYPRARVRAENIILHVENLQIQCNYMFNLSIKIFFSLNGKTKNRKTTALPLCSVQEVMCVISGFIALSLAPKLLHGRLKRKCHTR